MPKENLPDKVFWGSMIQQHVVNPYFIHLSRYLEDTIQYIKFVQTRNIYWITACAVMTTKRSWNDNTVHKGWQQPSISTMMKFQNN